MNNGGDHYVFVDLCKDGIQEQILERARFEYGPQPDDFEPDDCWPTYDDYLLEQYLVQAFEEIDL